MNIPFNLKEWFKAKASVSLVLRLHIFVNYMERDIESDVYSII